MLQAQTPDDYVIATNETHSVREFCDLAFGHVGLPLTWRGSGEQEEGVGPQGRVLCVSIRATSAGRSGFDAGGRHAGSQRIELGTDGRFPGSGSHDGRSRLGRTHRFAQLDFRLIDQLVTTPLKPRIVFFNRPIGRTWKRRSIADRVAGRLIERLRCGSHRGQPNAVLSSVTYRSNGQRSPSRCESHADLAHAIRQAFFHRANPESGDVYPVRGLDQPEIEASGRRRDPDRSLSARLHRSLVAMVAQSPIHRLSAGYLS